MPRVLIGGKILNIFDDMWVMGYRKIERIFAHFTTDCMYDIAILPSVALPKTAT